MKHAISTLQAALEVAQTNEPILRNEGQIEEANLRVQQIESFEKTISALQSLDKGDKVFFRECEECEGEGQHAFAINCPEFTPCVDCKGKGRVLTAEVTE